MIKDKEIEKVCQEFANAIKKVEKNSGQQIGFVLLVYTKSNGIGCITNGTNQTVIKILRYHLVHLESRN